MILCGTPCLVVFFFTSHPFQLLAKIWKFLILFSLLILIHFDCMSTRWHSQPGRVPESNCAALELIIESTQVIRLGREAHYAETSHSFPLKIIFYLQYSPASPDVKDRFICSSFWHKGVSNPSVFITNEFTKRNNVCVSAYCYHLDSYILKLISSPRKRKGNIHTIY